MVMEDYWQTYLKPYFKGAVLCHTINTCGYDKNKEGYNSSTFMRQFTGLQWWLVTNNSRLLFQLKDGVTVFFPIWTTKNGEIDYVSFFYIDVNGPKKPNTFNKDVFQIQRNTNAGITPIGTLLQIQKNGWKLP